MLKKHAVIYHSSTETLSIKEEIAERFFIQSYGESTLQKYGFENHYFFFNHKNIGLNNFFRWLPKDSYIFLMDPMIMRKSNILERFKKKNVTFVYQDISSNSLKEVNADELRKIILKEYLILTGIYERHGIQV